MKMTPVSSSAISAVGYDPEKRQMRIKFKGGHTHDYDDVDEAEHDEIVGAKSVGTAFNEFKKGRS